TPSRYAYVKQPFGSYRRRCSDGRMRNSMRHHRSLQTPRLNSDARPTWLLPLPEPAPHLCDPRQDPIGSALAFQVRWRAFGRRQWQPAADQLRNQRGPAVARQKDAAELLIDAAVFRVLQHLPVGLMQVPEGNIWAQMVRQVVVLVMHAEEKRLQRVTEAVARAVQNCL